MWPQKNLKILVPRTPPDPPLPPLTPPRGPGGPKMAKMHSLKSIDDNLGQKRHFWGVKKFDLFFHLECTKHFCLKGTEDTELTLTREGEFVGSEDDNVEEINIFDGQDNRITFEQVGDVENVREAVRIKTGQMLILDFISTFLLPICLAISFLEHIICSVQIHYSILKLKDSMDYMK